MSRFEAAPHPLLRPYVQSYWGFVRDLSKLGGFAVTPDRFVELLFFVGPPRVDGPRGREELPACVLIPLLDAPLRLETTGTMRCAAVRFNAWAAGIVVPQADDTARAWCDATPAFAALVSPVTQALRRADWPRIATVLDATLLGMIAAARPAGPALDAVRPFLHIPDEAAVAATGDVAARQGRSRRHIERSVRALTNRSPKQLVCLTRFQFVRDTLWARPNTDLRTLALDAGYADQAHLARHFRRYAGQSPSAFKRDCARLKTVLHAEDVAFVQDAARPQS